MSIGFILFLYNLFLCDIDSIYTMFFLILLVILYGPRVCNKRFKQIYATCNFLANKFVCTVFDLSTNPILLKIDMHIHFTMIHVWKSRFLKIIIASCKFMQLAIFANKLVCTVMTCALT